MDINVQHLAWEQTLKHADSPYTREDFCELQLPCNTDLAVLGQSDYQRNLNDPGVLRLLEWICEDVCLCIKRLLVHEAYRSTGYSTFLLL